MKEQIVPKDKIQYNTKQLLQLILFGVCGGFCFGYNSGVIASAIIYISNSFPDITVSE